ncbi:predicted protein [Nematostella vectensis]|uniref:G-protein coupled receptors family 1 profile domain-containing protein n=1 Tax=Nematostella vectensis TaxID=45351 RepID=A7SHR7_NEMVE|nr:predicted protein [Nematostella vectensis]|eukprot:XP_001628847.1 predicted protein [Nematostella vectensis]
MAGNSVIFRIIHQVKALQTPMNYLLLNIAILDIVSSVFFFFSNVILTQFMEAPSVLNIIRNNTNVAVADGVCKSVQIMWLTATVSPGLLTLIAFERYVAVVFPFKRNWHITRKRLRWLVPLCWIFGVARNVPEMVDYEFQGNACIKSFSHINNEVYSVVFLLFTFVLPVIAISFMYTKTIHKIWKKDEATANLPDGLLRNRKIEKKRIVTVLLTVTIIFFVVFGNGAIMFVLYAFDKMSRRLGYYFYYIYQTLFIFNSVVNPVVYLTCVKRFRDEFLKIVRVFISCCTEAKRYDMQKARENRRGTMTSSIATFPEYNGLPKSMELGATFVFIHDDHFDFALKKNILKSIFFIVKRKSVERIIHQMKALQTVIFWKKAILDIVSSVFFFFSVVILTQFMEGPSVLSIIRNNTNVAVADGVCKSVQIMWLSATVSPGLLTLIAFERGRVSIQEKLAHHQEKAEVVGFSLLAFGYSAYNP